MCMPAGSSQPCRKGSCTDWTGRSWLSCNHPLARETGLPEGQRAFGPHRARRSPDEITAVRDAISRAGPTGRINFAGMLDGDALDAAYCSSDLFVMPSLYEGYGMALTGAMAHGLPRVSTGGAAARTVPHGTGIKAPSAGAAALSGLSPAGAERTR